MTNPLRVLVLAALTGGLVSSLPIGPAAATHAKHVIYCELDKDCPKGDYCKIRPHHKTGICVSGKPKKHSY